MGKYAPFVIIIALVLLGGVTAYASKSGPFKPAATPTPEAMMAHETPTPTPSDAMMHATPTPTDAMMASPSPAPTDAMSR